MVFTAILVLPPVGHHLIVKSDEARFALLARDMVRRGAWFSAEVEGSRTEQAAAPLDHRRAVAAPGRGDRRTAQLPAAAAAARHALHLCSATGSRPRAVSGRR